MATKSAAGAILVGVVLAGGIAYSGGRPDPLAAKLDAIRLAQSGANPWPLLGMTAGTKTTRTTADCATLSDDQIRAFFHHTPCRSLNRTLYPVTLQNGTVIAVSVIWVGFTTPSEAQAFADLHYIHGNGDITPLPTTLLGLPPTPFTALNYDARVINTTVVFAETEAAVGTADHELLDTVAEIAVAFPKP